MFVVCCFVLKVVNDRQNPPQAINNLFTLNSQVHDYDTRQKEDLHSNNIITKTFGAETISHQGRTLWNQLPQNIKDEKTDKCIQKEIKSAYDINLLNDRK